MPPSKCRLPYDCVSRLSKVSDEPSFMNAYEVFASKSGHAYIVEKFVELVLKAANVATQTHPLPFLGVLTTYGNQWIDALIADHFPRLAEQAKEELQAIITMTIQEGEDILTRYDI